MPQLLLEFFSEEIPARMQKRAEEDLAKLMLDKLSAAGFIPEATKTFSTPRRLTIVVDGLPPRTPDIREEKKGPRVGAPEQALQGFLRSAGLSTIDQAQKQSDAKGEFYVAIIEKAGRETAALIGEIVPEIIRAFPWPKSMRSGTDDWTWVRPLQNILCTFDGEPVALQSNAFVSEAETRGHRFHAGASFRVKRFEDYADGLAKAHVVLDREERKRIIAQEAKTLCEARNLELVEDAGLLEEVAGLVEWPVPLMGDMDPAFLDLPGEVIRLTMRTHQKYFAVRDPKTKKLAPHFVTVANVTATDGGKAIAAGNARVLSARLNDARFFWDTDKKTPLYTEERKAKLEKIVFHQKLGSVWDKVERVKALAVELAPVVWESLARHSGAPQSGEPGTQGQMHSSTIPWVPDRALRVWNDAEFEEFVADVKRAADLCKMDLVTETVGEFPELQGQIGRQLYELELRASSPLAGEGREGGANATSASARANTPTPSPQGGGESVARAIEDHYRPLGPNDRVPSDPVAITLALADKLDTLVGFWAIDEKPTGSSDAYGLRRAALGFVRIVLTNAIRFHGPSPLAGEGRGGGRAERGASGAAAHHPDRPPPPTPSPQGEGGLDFRHYMLLATSRVLKARGLSDSGLLQLRNFSVRDVIFSPISDDELRRRFHGVLAAEDVESVMLVARGPTSLVDFLEFLSDRLKVQLRDQGKRHDLVDAVFAPINGEVDDDLVRIVARVDALTAFLATEDGANLLAGYKRAANILRAEERKGDEVSTLLASGELAKNVDANLFRDDAERALHAALETASRDARAAVEAENFSAAMGALARLRKPVDAFFEAVMVNDADPMLRRNRLALLSRMRAALHEVADFSKIEG